MKSAETLKFLSPQEIPYLAHDFGTPCFVYDLETLKSRYKYFESVPNAFGLTIRYSVKANPNRTILKIFDMMGACFDVSSVWEARRAINAGISADKILMTAQEASDGWEELCQLGMQFDAGSLIQLESYGKSFPGSKVSIRINPGFGSGLVRKLTSGGDHSSFGIWVEQLEKALDIAQSYSLTIERLHFHIGSGHETTVLEDTVNLALELCEKIDTVQVIDLGGGFRIASLTTDPFYDHHAMGARIASKFSKFADKHTRYLKLELEPGTYLASLSGSLITKVIDKVETGPNGYKFLKVDSGLTELMRPSYYGTLHPLITVSQDGQINNKSLEDYIVCGHCCIAGDVFTPKVGNSEDIEPLTMMEASPGDFIVVERSGGYAASMSVKNFNSYPEAPEVLRTKEGEYVLIRQRQTLEQMTSNEIDVDKQKLL